MAASRPSGHLSGGARRQDRHADRRQRAGKSTTLRTITGLVKASAGSILWNGQELLGKPIDKIVSAGIAMSPEGRRVFRT